MEVICNKGRHRAARAAKNHLQTKGQNGKAFWVSLYFGKPHLSILQKERSTWTVAYVKLVNIVFKETSQELGNSPMGQREALLKERLY